MRFILLMLASLLLALSGCSTPLPDATATASSRAVGSVAVLPAAPSESGLAQATTSPLAQAITSPLALPDDALIRVASAQLQDADGQIVGTALFTETEIGIVEIAVSVSGLPVDGAGEHGIHIHEVGACSPNFEAAGEHFNPTNAAHGLDDPQGPHAGDLPNIELDGAGSGDYVTTSDRFTLLPGPLSIFDIDGSALLIHAGADDQVSDPSGNSGERVACGVIMLGGDPTIPPIQSVPTVLGHVVQPEQLEVTSELIEQLELPEGFAIQIFAEGLGNVRMMAQAEDGTIYVTLRADGEVIALRDEDGDGRADSEPRTVATDLEYVHGIAVHEGRLYLVTDTDVLVADLLDDGEVDEFETLIDDLPDAGQHPNRTITFGPDGMMYISIGSTCNACPDSNEESATIVRAEADGSGRTILAEGLRNTIGFGFHPETGELWGMDHGTDWRGDNRPPEELNRIEEGNHYGWPFCYGFKHPDIHLPMDPEGMSKAEFCAELTTAPVLTYTAHASPIGMVFYTGDQFPDEYLHDAFIAMRGSWNRNPPSGYRVLRLRFDGGEPVGFEDFITSWLLEEEVAHFGRIAGLLVLQDGSLLISEDTNGVIYHVSFTGGEEE
jgi:glucose/arabinose dehydrogenase